MPSYCLFCSYRERMTINQVKESFRKRLVTGAFYKVWSHTDPHTSQALEGTGVQKRAGT